MFRTVTEVNGQPKQVAILFHQNEKRTICELRIGAEGTPPKEMTEIYTGKTKRMKTDKFDKAKGHLFSMERALDKVGKDIMPHQSRRDIYKAYSEWAIKCGLRTKVPMEKVGR